MSGPTRGFPGKTRSGTVVKWCFAASLLALFVAIPSISSFTFDSWSILELSRTVGHDFFRANTAREYVTGSFYSTAFPPLWPLIVALFTLAINNIYATYLAAFVAYAAFAYAAELLGRRAFDRPWVGLLSALLLLRFPGLRSELGAGRSIPFYLLVLAIAGCLLMRRESATKRRAFLLGLTAGALTMTRFDALPATMVVAIGTWFVGARRERFVLILAGIAVALSPWIVYSLVHFHTVFATDNRLVALSLDPRAFVLDYHIHSPRVIGDDPGAWMAKTGRNIPAVSLGFSNAIAQSIFLPILVLLTGASAIRGRALRSSPANLRPLALLVLLALAPLAGNVMTGYVENRYFAAPVWMLEFLLLGFLARIYDTRFPTIAIVLAVAGTALNTMTLRYAFAASPVAAVRSALDHEVVDSLESCLRRDGAGPEQPVVFRQGVPIDPARFGALTGQRVLPIPSNWVSLTTDDRIAFLRSYHARYVAGMVPPSESVPGLEDDPLPCRIPLRRIHLGPG